MFGKLKLTKKELSWALYDVGNSAFYTTVVAGFFPVFFKQYWNMSAQASVSTFNLSLATSIAALIVALVSPILGSFSDKSNLKLTVMCSLSLLAIIFCAMLAFVGSDQYQLAMILFSLSSIGAALAITVYDALLVSVTSKNRYNIVSLSGFALGYLGGGLFFLFNIILTLQPQWFFLDSKVQAVKVSIFLVSLWWLCFMLPIYFNLKTKAFDKSLKKSRDKQGLDNFFKNIIDCFKDLYKLFIEIKTHKTLFLFLCAYWFYIDGVGTIMRMAVDYGVSLGFESSDLMIALLIVQFVGFPATYGFVLLSKLWGAKNCIFIAIFIYIIINIRAYYMDSIMDFYLLASALAIAQGGLQALSRSYFASMIPKNRSGEFFGFYNSFGKFASIIGPFMIGWVALATGSNRLSILSVLVLFIAGSIILMFVPSDKTRSHE